MPQFLVAQIIGYVAWMLDSLLSLYFWLIIISALLSWVNPDPRNPIVSFLRSVTEPVLYQVRRRLPFVAAGGIDFSPIVVILLIAFMQRVVVSSLYELAARIRMAASTGAFIA